MSKLVPGASGEGGITAAQLAAAFHRATMAADLAEEDGPGLDAALGALCEGLDDAFVAAFVLDNERLWLVGTSRYTMIPDAVPLEAGVVGRAARTGEVQFVADVTQDADFVDVTPGTVSQLAVPLSVGQRLVGVLSVESTATLPRPPLVALDALAQTVAQRLDGLRTSRAVDLSMLARLFVFISSLRDTATIAEVTCRALARVLPLDTSQLALVGHEGHLFESAGWRASSEGPALLDVAALERVRRALSESAVFEVYDLARFDEAGHGPRSVVAVPLRANGGEIGLFVGTSRFAREFERYQAEAAALFGAQVAASLDAAVSLDRERTSALTDPLTGLLNRRGFDIRLERELETAQEARRTLSVLILDCDDFKEANDRAGHEFGDTLLMEMGDVLTAAVGPEACVARLGGDEFVIMLPDVDGETAADMGNEIRDKLAAGISDAGFPMRVSGGIATYPYDGSSGAQLLRAADQALYEAKGRGKNRISTFREVVRVGTELDPADGRRMRGSGRPSSATLADAAAAAEAIWNEQTVGDVLARLGKSLTFVVGATGCNVSRLADGMLVDATAHSLRATSLGDDAAYLVDDFPLTKAVLAERRPRAISFLDEELDKAEAFVLREIGMNCALLVPIVVGGDSWGLAEVYDMRLRSYGAEEIAISEFLVGQAGRKLETFTSDDGPGRTLPVYRLPDA